MNQRIGMSHGDILGGGQHHIRRRCRTISKPECRNGLQGVCPSISTGKTDIRGRRNRSQVDARVLMLIGHVGGEISQVFGDRLIRRVIMQLDPDRIA